MPTILVVDVSLSMSRCVALSDTEQWSRRQMAAHGANLLLDRIALANRIEFVSLVIYSSLYQQVVPFTRDLSTVRAALRSLTAFDRTDLVSALSGINTMVLEEWGAMIPCQVIVVTDGTAGIGPSSLPVRLQEFARQEPQPTSKSNFPLPFRFSGSLYILCLAAPTEPCLQATLPLYQKLIELNGNGGELLLPEGLLTLSSVEGLFRRLADKYYRQFKATLRCGHLKSPVILFPPPDTNKVYEGADGEEIRIGDTIDILGFLATADVSSPPVSGKHLVLPLTQQGHVKLETSPDPADQTDEDREESQRVSFTVLLHGSLKVEGMVAIARIAENWFGMLYSWADNKKKSNLMFSPFQQGVEHIAWLGPLSHLAPVCDFEDSPYGEDDSKSPFPVKQERRSYAQNTTVWIKAPGLQADVQKILRHGRKLPDKQQHFYKELNRLRRMALSLGFTELLTALAVMLERECSLLPASAHPDAAQQLTHAAKLLQSASAREFAVNIMPLRTDG